MRAQFLSLLAISTCLLISFSQAEVCNPHDKKTLLLIKKSLGDPYLLTSWENTTDCCTEWSGIRCDRKTHSIISLTVFDDNVIPDSGQIPASGQFPPAVGDLPYLQELYFHNLPLVTGPLPQELANLKHLKFLRLDMLNLTGPIPSIFGQLKKLYYINLAYNKLSGSIPSSLGELPGSPSLYIDLSHNQLTGMIPTSFNNLLHLSNIHLSRNKLEGDASMLFGPNKTVEVVILDRNQLKFNLSTVVFPSSLTALEIDHNKIYGSLPPQMNELSLHYLNVSYNRLCGEIPVGDELQSFDTYNYLHNKCLCGAPLPACKQGAAGH